MQEGLFVSGEPVLDKAMGVQCGFQSPLDMGFSNVVILSNTLFKVNCILGKSSTAAISPVIHDYGDLLARIPHSSIAHVRRELNIDAQNLVSLAKVYGCKSWVGYPLASLFATDANIVILGVVSVLFYGNTFSLKKLNSILSLYK